MFTQTVRVQVHSWTHLQEINDCKRDINTVTTIHRAGLANYSKHQPKEINECFNHFIKRNSIRSIKFLSVFFSVFLYLPCSGFSGDIV